MYSAMQEFRETLIAAKVASVPIIAIRSADPNATLAMFSRGLFDPSRFDTFPMLRWDVVDGFKAVNDAGKAPATALAGQEPPPSFGSREPRLALTSLASIPDSTIAFFINAHRYLDQIDVLQAVYNLRDRFPEKNKTLVLLLQPGSAIPAELTEHVVVFDEPLPTRADLKTVVQELVNDTVAQVDGMQPVPETDIEHATDALSGLTIFAAQQTVAMCLSKQGLNLDRVWNRKVEIIQQTPGLSVWKGGERFEDIAGIDNVQTYLRLILHSSNPPGAIVFLDEIEKHLAGHGTDQSGVKTEMVGYLLTWMADRDARGVIFVGPSGTAKSATGKATGNEISKPTIKFDFSGMQDAHVGKSGQHLRTGLNVVDAVSQSNPFFIATSNNLSALPPELLRRFTKGIFFFDLPDENARTRIWDLYCEKFNVSGPRPHDKDWSGSDIRNCCQNASESGISLIQASNFIVPVGVSSKEQIRQLRLQATGRYINAAAPGTYTFDDDEGNAPAAGAGRSMRMLGTAQNGR